MNRKLSIAAFSLSAVLLLPYLFYALIFRGMIASLWTLGCLVAFLFLVTRFRKAGLHKLLIISAVASAAIALSTLPIGSFGFTVLFLGGSMIVMSLFAFAMAKWQQGRVS
jgi:hypothetical protein